MEDVIYTEDLSKVYGKTKVVDSLSLHIPRGSIYGFIGPNGSGKSTTMKMILGLTRPTSGKVFLGCNYRAIGSMIESPPGYAHLTGWENLKILQHMLDLKEKDIQRALSLVRLNNQRDKLVKEYSLGMKQRLGIAYALARNPEVLILDEPTNGLDPAGIEEIRQLLIELSTQGISIMVSSHLLDEINKMATHLGIIAGGKLLFEGTKKQLFGASTPDLLISCSDPATAQAIVGGEIHQDVLRLSGVSLENAAVINRRLSECVDVYELRRATQSLEDVFISLTGEAVLQ
ncbi:ATP-binding cassette domain-containing protein [Corynebacterium poyangense]|uniref:ATP-binding cassette domain-containing protein n=1 Tax=Corynebacterium poyangense TaxID=2684405 RepID=A0A7H0SPX8_9CORY|nr:ATP-binding cassette domain-containing protein [Corynebacterium poyangense]MBZ8178472.1 ATP-binding cassette domain-containing protein [Corynebacterium poyangense]QNQ90603.1 ATP-binding cassette domain-containing protein [Corynebacterium poyangense]